ncbi:TonB-dependent receptor domain-containing protein [Sphingosinicella humi]|uniref:TonB-dependent receptor n=1 Tax=Allosphingosinicella humi TaxID=2068657 RepID=A0A2U2IZK8_9SPHN|nr:TonB-dependent receptor [Sphingosinicella humi]PWG01532.1 TonB-dependent receptor [Sphingosinicella humi]
MRNIAAFGSLLLLSTALIAPAALAQTVDAAPEPAAEVPPVEPVEEEIEISGPGAPAAAADIVVVGRNIPNAIRRTPEVISVLSTADIARTGEGDIAGALKRITGLSVVGGRFVYVRGLGERYSLALLNGSPLPSPEPLRRVVPLDIFPTDVIASSVVQKSYSVNYPGEFGGGVVNLTTKSMPDEAFLTIGGSLGFDTETTGELGYTYYGGDTDWTGFDDGTRDIPAGLAAAMDSGNLIVIGPNFSEEQVKGFTASLVNAPTTLIQRNNDIPINGSLNVSAGKSWDIGSSRFGVIAAAGWDNKWQTKGGLQQLAGGIAIGDDGSEILKPDQDFRFLSTENRIVVNGLLGLGLEFGEHALRWTNLYIRDTIKEARIQTGTDQINVGDDLLNIGNTAWFERQLIDTQLVGEFDWDPVSLDIRGTYANSQRESPYERTISYRFNNVANDFVNDLRSNGEYARIAFSDLSDNVYSGSADLAYELPTTRAITASAGLSYFKNDRSAERREFRYTPLDALPFLVTQQRPDYLLSDYNVHTWDIVLTDVSSAAGVAAYEADLEVFGAYAQVEAELVPTLRLQAGVRFEDGKQSVTPIDLFGLGGANVVPTEVENSYWLPAATLTWNFAEDMQFRLHASKTIARPQFRELAPQQYLDTETDRTFFGNQFLTDSELFNAEARYEYYFGPDQRVSLAGFYKKIDRPIEAVAFEQGGTFFTTFANAPEATLVGGEIEVQKYVPLDMVSSSDFFAARRLVLIGNYTFTDSDIKVGPNDTTIPIGSGGMPVQATNLFADGSRLTGQSRHLANLQIGLENQDRLSQQTLMLTYASRRVTNRGPSGQPDLIEEPGFRLDFVAREGIRLLGADMELKFEARNLLGENYEEYQTLNGSRIDTNSYDLGRVFSLGLGMTF